MYRLEVKRGCRKIIRLGYLLTQHFIALFIKSNQRYSICHDNRFKVTINIPVNMKEFPMTLLHYTNQNK